MIRCAAPLLAGVLCLSSPAQAQFSDGYKFLEAVKKKDVVKVEERLSEPGSTVIHSRDVSDGRGALHIVIEMRDAAWLRYLVGKGANVNMRDNEGVAPLQLATSLGWIEGVELLVSRKADLDESNDTGETPLISAVHRRDTNLMRILLKGGADPDRADNSGRSARDYARLSSKDAQLLATIKTHAKKKTDKKASNAVYGPTF
ncbi:MAG: ankyrin repeat domain-containing protein [Sphingomonadaceae bacterium]|nr:ankyrin repeat domain-containing protein [Sphingomonadaceae bacterium]